MFEYSNVSMLNKWLITFRSPAEIWAAQCTYMLLEIVLLILSVLTLKHARKTKGRFAWLWFAASLHGLLTESVSYVVDEIDNFWHSQSMVMLFNQRWPLHIAVLYPVFYYISSFAVSCMKLPWWSEPFAVALFDLLLDLPFDMIGIRYLWWTWHDTEANILDRTYYIPWTSYYFHLSFTSTFMILFNGLHRLFSGLSKFSSSSFCTELSVACLTGLLSFPGAVLQFSLLYHLLHDLNNIHSQVPTLILVALYVSVAWLGDRHPTTNARATMPKQKGGASKGKPMLWWLNEISLGVILWYALHAYVILAKNPEDEISTGLHETVGDSVTCKDSIEYKSYTLYGPVNVSKRRFLCTDDFDEAYTFECPPTGPWQAAAVAPGPGARWYSVCGKAFDAGRGERLEYVAVVLTQCALGLLVFFQALAHSGCHPAPQPTKRSKSD